jgi:phosphoenolpyruvate phosphomutase
VPEAQIHGVWMGFLKVSPTLLERLPGYLDELLAQPGQQKAALPDLLQALLQRQQPIRVLYTAGHWLDINSLEDVVLAGNF